MTTLTEEDEELMGTLDLNDFLPTNDELNNEADLNRLGSQSITDLDIPNLSNDAVNKLQYFGHQDVDYHNPSSAHAATMGNKIDNDDVFDVDFDGEGDNQKGKPQLAATAPVKLQTPATKIAEPVSTNNPPASDKKQQKQPPSKIKEEEEEEELLVIPTSKKVQPATNVTAVVAHKHNSPTTHTTKTEDDDDLDMTMMPPTSVQQERSREDSLPGKLQKKVSEARLLQNNNNMVTEDELKPATQDEDEEMMTDIEELLLNRDRQMRQQHQEDEEEEEFALHKQHDDFVENDNDNNDNNDGFEINVDAHMTHRYSRTKNHHGDEEEGGEEVEDYEGEDDSNPKLKQHDGQEPQPIDNNNKNKAKERKSKLLVSQDRGDNNNSATDENGNTNNNNSNTKERPYQHPMNQAKFTVGNRTLTMAEAKLYGLVDAEGKQISASSILKSGAANKVPLKRLSDMAVPRTQIAGPTPEEEGFTFQPLRSESALRAMKNPKLGYDFVDRMNTGVDFLQRLDKDNQKKIGGQSFSKAELAVMEEDYNAKLDKLTCPNCGKEQSFDEHLERSRMCRLCNVKYSKAKISSGLGFIKQNAQREAEKQRKLQKIEEEMYGKVGQTKTAKARPASATTTLPTIPVRNTNANLTSKKNNIVENNNLLTKPPSPGDEAANPFNNIDNNNKTKLQPRPPATTKAANNTGQKAAATTNSVDMPLTSNQNAAEAVETMRRLHNSKAQALNSILANLTGAESAPAQPNKLNNNTANTSKNDSKQNRPRDSSVGRKMDRLVQLD